MMMIITEGHPEPEALFTSPSSSFNLNATATTTAAEAVDDEHQIMLENAIEKLLLTATTLPSI